MPHQQDRTPYWQEILENFLTSGLKTEEYAKQHKVSKASLYKWSKRLAIPLNQTKAVSCEQQDQEKPLSFLEIKELTPARYIPQVPVKLEICGKGGTAIKAELTGEWEQVADLLKALAI